MTTRSGGGRARVAAKRRRSKLVLILGAAGAEVARSRRHISSAGYSTRHARTPSECMAMLDRWGASALVVVASTLDHEPARTLAHIIARDPNLPVIIAGAHEQLGLTTARDHGVTDYVPGACDQPEDLLDAIAVVMGHHQRDVQLRTLRQRDGAAQPLASFFGSDPCMSEPREIARDFCDRTMAGLAPPLLLLGELGTGKSTLARRVHYNSARYMHPFIELDCGSYMQESQLTELLGYERGAFTSARSPRSGLLEAATGGTLFLRRVHKLSLAAQAAVLSAIDHQTATRLGGMTPHPVDIQVISSAPPDLSDGVRGGTFSQELLRRLSTVCVDLPALRDRGTDAVRLAESLVRELCEAHGASPKRLGHSARRHVLDHGWPGNAHELRNELERIVLTSDADEIRASHFGATRRTKPRSSPPRDVLADVADEPGYRLHLPPDGVPLALLERDVIVKALERCQGNVSRTARYLRVSRQTLMYRMKKHGVRLAARRPETPSMVTGPWNGRDLAAS